MVPDESVVDSILADDEQGVVTGSIRYSLGMGKTMMKRKNIRNLRLLAA